jgi:photosystem II stability/assembly factor-like uncharacterized protein
MIHRIRTACLVLVMAILSLSLLAEDGHPSPALTPQQSGTTNSLIAVSPVNSRVVWASGRNGTFVRTTDGGKTWKAGVVAGAEALQFRDVQAVSADVAYLLSIGNGTDSRIYRTTDGGKTWTMQFQNHDPNAFYDCMAFWSPRRGLAHSDSVNGRFPELRTLNGGHTWSDIGDNLPPALPGESSFASSGTCVATQGWRNAWIGTGGISPSRVLVTHDMGNTWNAYPTALRGSASAGVFSVAFRDSKHGMIGGGDLDAAAPPFPQTAISHDAGQTWTLTDAQPGIGTVFGLSYARNSSFALDDNGCEDSSRTVVVTGPGGAAWTRNEGKSWTVLPNVTGYWGVAFADEENGWLVGVAGAILKIHFPR